MVLILRGHTPAHAYRVAQTLLWADTAIRCLAPFNSVGTRPPEAPPQPTHIPIATRRMRAWVAGRQRLVTSGGQGTTFAVRVEGVGGLLVTPQAVTLTHTAPHATPDDVEQMMIGPGLLLHLAMHGIYTLHASAVEIDGGAVLFLADSGTGKSTVAHTFNQWGPRRLADDALPIHEGVALPHYPQLKLPLSEQGPPTTPAERPITAITLLNHAAAFSIKRLPPQAATAVLVRHTMATSLFSGGLLAQHLAACAHLADRVPVFGVGYPHTAQALHKLYEALHHPKPMT